MVIFMNKKNIQIISAPSILGLKPTGVEKLADSLLSNGLMKKLKLKKPVLTIPTFNDSYTFTQDPANQCLNVDKLRDFSLILSKQIFELTEKENFLVVLGGDCSILLGITLALKMKGEYGLIFFDAHADFYEPEKSLTGETADMDLAIITGNGPEILGNINDQKPYIKEKNVIHIGQRDWEETQKYGSQDIKDSDIKCFDLKYIKKHGSEKTSNLMIKYMKSLNLENFWIHFDTDVLSDELNPAVDYRLPDGLSFEDCEYFMKELMKTGKIAGISITIFNPELDVENTISKKLVDFLAKFL